MLFLLDATLLQMRWKKRSSPIGQTVKMKTGSLRAPASCWVWPELLCTAVTREAFCVGACLWSNFRGPRTVGESAGPSLSYSLLACAAHCVRGKADPSGWCFLRLLVPRNYHLQSLDSWCEKPARTQGHFLGCVKVWLVCPRQTSQCLGGSSESSDTSSFHFESVFKNRITKLLIKQNKDTRGFPFPMSHSKHWTRYSWE